VRSGRGYRTHARGTRRRRPRHPLQREAARSHAFLFADGTLVDAGVLDSAGALLAGIAETGIDPERLVVTHADSDLP